MGATFDGNSSFYIGAVDWGVEEVIAEMPKVMRKHADRKTPGTITFYINSHGGYVHLARHIISLMEVAKNEGVIVETVVPTVAYSAGSMIAVAGSVGHRYIGKSGEHLLHYGQAWSSSTSPLQVDRQRDWLARHFKDIVRHYEYYCAVPNLVDHIGDDSFFVTAAQAKKWGLADHYMEKFTF